MSLVTGSRYYWLHLDDISILLLPPPVILPSEINLSVSENLDKKSLSFGTFGLGKNLSFGFGNFGLGKSLGFGFGKEKIKVTRKNLDQVNSPSLKFEF